MHYIAEVVIPPTKNVKGSIEQVMENFDENRKESEDDYDVLLPTKFAFWDFWIIGGRFSGHKLEALIGTDNLKRFHEALIQKNVTVSSMTCGRQELQPKSQIPMVDALWREMFPGKGEQCPIFNHARDQYGKKGVYADDICKVSEVPDELTCFRLIICRPAHDYQKDKRLRVEEMYTGSIWNGVTWRETKFDGKVKPALEEFRKKQTEHVREEYQIKNLNDYLVVTVDYHS